MSDDDKITIDVFYETLEEQTRAMQILEDAGEPNPNLLDGLIEGEVTIDNLEVVRASGLPFDLPNGMPDTGASLMGDGARKQQLFPGYSVSPDEAKTLESFANRSLHIDLAKAESSAADTAPTIQMAGGVQNLAKALVSGIGGTAGIIGIGTNALGRVLASVSDHINESDPDRQEEDVFRIALNGPIRDEWRDQLTAIGAEPVVFDSPVLFDAFLTPAELEQVEQLPFVTAVKRYALAETVAPNMRKALQRLENEEAGSTIETVDDNGEAPATSKSDIDDKTQLRKFDAIVHRESDLEMVKRMIEESTKRDVLDYSDRIIRFEIELASPFLATLANMPQIRSVSLYTAPSLFSDLVRGIIGIERVQSDPIPWDGRGQIVAIIDSGVDDEHPDLNPICMINYGRGLAKDQVGHGTHVAGIICGSGSASNGSIKGIAPGAELLSLGIVDSHGDLDLPVDISTLLQIAADHGARIINLSLGWPKSQSSEYHGQFIDRFIHENPDILVVVAAGNDGEAPDGYHELYKLAQPASAKNVLTIGASASSRPDDSRTWGQEKSANFPKQPASDELVSGDPDAIAALGSRGPTESRMTKPDLIAPGTRILSARANGATHQYYPPFNEFDDRYGILSGTSMAAPVVAASAAIMRQYIIEKLGHSEPSAALLKAVLIAGAKRLAPGTGARTPDNIGYPDFEQGFGRIDLISLLPPEADSDRVLFHFADIANDSPDALVARATVAAARQSLKIYRFSITQDTPPPLRICLAWTDPPGRTLQNDLDLSLRLPDSKILYGNADQKAFHSPLDALRGGISFDNRNNVEIVTLENPQPGDYSITVRLRSNTYPPQGYGLCVVGGGIDSMM